MRFSYLLSVLMVSLLALSCGTKHNVGKPGSSGKTLEMLVVADRDVYTVDFKAVVDTLFRAPQEGLAQAEPLFDVANIPTTSFRNTDMFRVHRNVLLCEVKPGNPDKVYVYRDKYASPQIIFEVAASNRDRLDSLVRRYAPQIIYEMRQADYRRVIKAFEGMKGVEVMRAVKQQFGFSLSFSDEFAVANANNPADNFAWIRKEAKDFGIGVLVYVTKYTSSHMFEQQAVLDTLDAVMQCHVPGSADSSYMGTERRVDATTASVTFTGSPYAVETRGLWRTFGDFMGGPYVSYTMLSPDSTQVIYLTGYVYCPRFEKRDYLMQVDAICHSIRFE